MTPLTSILIDRAFDDRCNRMDAYDCIALEPVEYNSPEDDAWGYSDEELYGPLNAADYADVPY